MKTIINGKRYDTTTAEQLATWQNHYNCTDFAFCEETLYRTKRGSFFLHGEGGALSKYAQPYGNNGSCGGSELIPMTDGEAKEWLEDRGHVETLEKVFADQLQDA